MATKKPKKPKMRHPNLAQTLLRKAGPIQSSKEKRRQNKERRELAERIRELDPPVKGE